MDKKQKDKQGSDAGLMKTGRSRRKRAGRAGRGKGIPRVMIVGGVLIVIGAAWLYWPAGNSAPTGLGEQQTVVTSLSDSVVPAGGTGPSSGDVDINQQTTSLTPEEPESGQEANAAEIEAEKAEAEAQPMATKPVVEKPAPKPVAPAPRIQPTATGSYAVQVGSFGDADNADKEAARLKELGWNTSIRAGNNSSGQMVFRVWITHFKTRRDAQTFINQNSRKIPGAIPVHR